MLFQIRAVISKWDNYFKKGHNSTPLKWVWFLPGSKASCSLKHLRDNLAQTNCDLGNMYVNFLNKFYKFSEYFLIDDIGTLTPLQLLPWIISSVEKTSMYWPSISCISRHVLFYEKRWYSVEYFRKIIHISVLYGLFTFHDILQTWKLASDLAYKTVWGICIPKSGNSH